MEVAADYYATLGVDTRADADAIRRAYRKLMRRHHPDVSRSADADARAKAINEAYACLHDPLKRADYDGRLQARRSTRRAPAASRPVRPFHPTWGTQHVDAIHKDAVIPKRWKIISLGLAAIVTVITFSMTSAVDTTGSVPVEPDYRWGAPR